MLTDIGAPKNQSSNQLLAESIGAITEGLDLLIDGRQASRTELQTNNDELTVLNLELSRLNAQLQAALADQEISRKKLEEQTLVTQNLMEVHSKELEEKVCERTQELKNAVGELKQMNKELVSFTYISSHDLQEPLRKIQTFSSRILKTDYDVLSDGGKESFQRINDSASRMQTLIRDLLTYSQTNVEERKFQQTNLSALVQEVVAEYADDINASGAIIDVAKLCPVRINPFQFRQVLHNLVSNSLKFFRAGVPLNIKMTCSTSRGAKLLKERPDSGLSVLDPRKQYSHFSFSDNGIGFEPQYNERVFEIFQRLHNRKDYKGTGIGLAIVKKIVEHHYGVVTASGEPGVGVCFDIYLPAD